MLRAQRARDGRLRRDRRQTRATRRAAGSTSRSTGSSSAATPASTAVPAVIGRGGKHQGRGERVDPHLGQRERRAVLRHHGLRAARRAAGDAGSIDGRDTLSLKLENGGQISTARLGAHADGGNITIQARERVELENSRISTNVERRDRRQHRDRSRVRDPAQRADRGAGRQRRTGGSIDITAGLFVADVESLVSASSASGIDGTVVIRSPDVDLVGRSGGAARRASSIRQTCWPIAAPRARRTRNGSLTLRELDALPDWPGRLRPSRYAVRARALGGAASCRRSGARRARRSSAAIDALALERWERAAALAPYADPAGRCEARQRAGAGAIAADTSARSRGSTERWLRSDSEARDGRGCGARAAGADARRASRARARARSRRATPRCSRASSRPRRGAQQRAGEREAALRAYAEAERFAKRRRAIRSSASSCARIAPRSTRSGDPKRARPSSPRRADLARVPDDHDAAFAALHTIARRARPRSRVRPGARAARPDRAGRGAPRRRARRQLRARAASAGARTRAGRDRGAPSKPRARPCCSHSARAPPRRSWSRSRAARPRARGLGQGAAAVRALETRVRAARRSLRRQSRCRDARARAHASWFATAAAARRARRPAAAAGRRHRGSRRSASACCSRRATISTTAPRWRCASTSPTSAWRRSAWSRPLRCRARWSCTRPCCRIASS